MSLQDKLNAAATNFGQGEFQEAYDDYVLALAEVCCSCAYSGHNCCWRVGRVCMSHGDVVQAAMVHATLRKVHAW